MLLNELFEQEGKHITFCFGRMNPPTIGHEQVFKTMAAQGGEYLIFVSQSQDRKENPLSYSDKIKFIKTIHPQYADAVVENTALNTVVKVASYLYDQGYRNATFVAGSDRLDSFKKLLSQYNGVEGKAHGYYKFDVLDFVSAGERDPDSEGISGVSASKARGAAANNDFEGFKEATGAGEVAKPMFDAVRKGMGITESIDNLVELADDEAYYRFIVAKIKTGRELSSREKEFIKQYQLFKKTESTSEGQFRKRDIEDVVIPNNKLNDLKSKYLPDWEMLDHKLLQAKYVAKDHRYAEEFVSYINKISEQMDHFAEVTQDVAEVTVKTSTFDVKGLTILDFKLALKIDKFADKNDIEQVRMQGNFGMHESNYGRYWCSTDKKWKTRKGPKQKRSS